LIRAAVTSVADLCIIPMQDWLGLDSDCRMNIPSHPEDNWTWRLSKDAIRPELVKKIAELIEVSDRDPQTSAPVEHSHRKVTEEFAA
jgi:4-alpha-glucanotransferase